MAVENIGSLVPTKIPALTDDANIQDALKAYHYGSYDFDTALIGADAVMMLRIQLERMSEMFFPNAREYSRYFGLNGDRVKSLKPSTLVMHPGPMNRGLEITADAADGARSVIVEQVSNGVSVRMAILYMLLAGASEGEIAGTNSGTGVLA